MHGYPYTFDQSGLPVTRLYSASVILHFTLSVILVNVDTLKHLRHGKSPIRPHLLPNGVCSSPYGIKRDIENAAEDAICNRLVRSDNGIACLHISVHVC